MYNDSLERDLSELFKRIIHKEYDLSRSLLGSQSISLRRRRDLRAQTYCDLFRWTENHCCSVCSSDFHLNQTINSFTHNLVRLGLKMKASLGIWDNWFLDRSLQNIKWNEYYQSKKTSGNGIYQWNASLWNLNTSVYWKKSVSISFKLTSWNTLESSTGSN